MPLPRKSKCPVEELAVVWGRRRAGQATKVDYLAWIVRQSCWDRLDRLAVGYASLSTVLFLRSDLAGGVGSSRTLYWR